MAVLDSAASFIEEQLSDQKVQDIITTTSTFSTNIENNLTITKNEVDENIENIIQTLDNSGQDVVGFAENIFTTIKDLSDADVESSQSNINNAIINSVNTTADGVSSTISSGIDFVNNLITSSILTAKEYVSLFGDSEIGNVVTKGLNAGLSSLLPYQDGIEETDYGQKMSSSWTGKGQNSFLDTFTTSDQLSRKVRVMNSTPLDAGEDKRSALFGTLMMGCPYTYGGLSDPRNRQFINSFVKDSQIVSFTPGFPKYNGGYYMQSEENSILNQTETGSEMLDYLLKNGLDESFSDKDKRYYTFKADYETYYSYLEAMLNPIWLKMGLGTVDSQTFDIFSFFNIKKPTDGESGTINKAGYTELKNQYKSSLGFFLNGTAGVSESVDSEMTSYGSESSQFVNDQSEAYQKINYFTGMGTGSNAQQLIRTASVGLKMASQIGTVFSELTSNTRSGAQTGWDTGKNLGGTIGGIIGMGVGAAVGAATDIATAGSERDMSALIQSFAVSNGLKVVHPELWADSNYARSINLNFEFISPYGDPYSIFKYVYVPLCSLMCLSFPRAAADNGYVSPMFVRCDIPGHITSDLGIISNMTWTKGGNAGLWTKDGLPRAMSVQLSVSDLYPYLAMSKRFSFLSANPSYATFLDNMAGLCKVYSGEIDDPLNAYWERLINRVNGLQASDFSGGLWNKSSQARQGAYNTIASDARKSVSSRSMGVKYSSIPWVGKV